MKSHLTLISAGLLLATFAASASAGTKRTPSVKDFVRKGFVHGIPFEETREFGAKEVQTLLAMLEDPREEAHWRNVVILLGFVGQEDVVAPLVRHLTKESEEVLSHEDYRSRGTVLMALGYLANRTGSAVAMQALIEASDPESWKQLGVTWRSPYGDELQRNRRLATMALIGLGLSGRPEAVEALSQLYAPGLTAENEEFRSGARAVVDEALKAHAIIARGGLTEYYKLSN